MSTVKFIEIDIEASGFGCVNTNGNINPRTGKEAGEDGFSNMIYPKSRDGQLYISNNCIRGHLFAEEARGLMLAGKTGFNNNSGDGLILSAKDMPKDSQKIASSYLGLIRGYMLTEKGGESVKRKSPLTITDFVNIHEQKPNKNEIKVNHLALKEDGTKDKNSLFYEETWGDTHYRSTSIISIEQLQFIALDSRLGHKSVCFGNNPRAKNVNEQVELFVDNLINNIKKQGEAYGIAVEGVNAEHGYFEKTDTLFQYPEEGILLNNQAIHVLVESTIKKLESLQILKSGGFMKVDRCNTKYLDGLNSVLDDLGDTVPEYHCFMEASKVAECVNA
jgi:hypothetical protein